MFRTGDQEELIVQHMELCSMLCGSLDGRAVWGRLDTCMCMAESLRCSPETVPALFVDPLFLLFSHSAVSDSL